MAEYTIKDSLSSVAEYIGEAVATKENAFRVSTMPAASADYAGEIYQYVGATDASYTNGYYYECAEDNGVYGWQQINVQPSNESGQTIQYDQMPVASVDNLNQIIQYTGATTSVEPIYTNGYFYKCVAQGTDPETYAWEQTNVQPTSEGDERIKSEITEMGVKFDDGLRPYIKVDISKIIPSFADATWDDIAMISDLYYSGDLSLEDIRNVWSVGDSKDMLVSAMPATGVGETHAEQTVTVKLVDFNHDALVTAEGEKTKALLTLGFELAENGAIHTSSVNVVGTFGWENCARRTWCNNVCKDAIPENLRSLMKSVIKTTDKINASLTGVTTNDYVFIPTINEYIGRTINATEAGAQYTLHAGYGGTQYAYHAMSGARTKTMCTSSFYEHHWSEVTYVARNQLATTSGGASGTNNVTTSSGLMPHFCI